MSHFSGADDNDFDGSSRFSTSGYKATQRTVTEDNCYAGRQYPSDGRNPLLINPGTEAAAYGYYQRDWSSHPWDERRPHSRLLAGNEGTPVSEPGWSSLIRVNPDTPEATIHGTDESSRSSPGSNQWMATDYLRDTIIPDSIGIQAQYLEARGHFTKRRSWKPEEVSGSGGGSHLPFSGRTLAPAVPASQNLSRRASPPVHPPASLYYPEQGLFASPAGNNAPHVDPARFITPSYQRFSDDSPMGMDRDERVADQIQVPAREGSVPLVYMDQQPIPQPGDAIRCPYGWCSSTFTRIGDLERHLTTASIHNPTKAGTADSSKRCRKCGEQFSRSDARNRHELKNSCWKRKHTSRRTSQHDAV